MFNASGVIVATPIVSTPLDDFFQNISAFTTAGVLVHEGRKVSVCLYATVGCMCVWLSSPLYRSLIIEPWFGSDSKRSQHSTRSLPFPMILLTHSAHSGPFSPGGREKPGRGKQRSWEARDDRNGSTEALLFFFFFFLSKGRALRGYKHPRANILVCRQIFQCVGVCYCNTHAHTHTHRERVRQRARESTQSIFSIFHALGIRHTRSDRNLAKWDKIIKLQGTLLSFSTKWIKWCQHVTASPPGSEKYWQDYKLKQLLRDETANPFPSREV